MKLTRAVLAAGLAALLAVSVTACGGGDSSSGKAPLSVLKAAKAKFDAASSVHLTMSTTSKPTSGDAVLGADGTLTHQPAFQGKVKIFFKGFDADIPVVAVGGKVYAKLPLTLKFSTIDPSEYGAPDPAEFADTSQGISGLLLKLGGLKESGQIRDGKQVLTRYTGTLAGDLVQPIIPSASKSGSYDTVVGIDSGGRIATLRVTGDFFASSGAVTYALTFDDYDKKVEISQP
jgi:lipoprotein LprG